MKFLKLGRNRIAGKLFLYLLRKIQKYNELVLCLFAVKMREILVAHLTQTIQNNKCPHGFIIGTCPICSGMGSRISSNKDKPRKAGEMSYNECLAQWIKMQALQNAKKEASIERFENLFSIKDKITQTFNKINSFINEAKNFINTLPKIIKTPINLTLKILSTTFKTIAKIVQNSINFTQNLFNDIKNFITSTIEKLSSLLGEIKNFIKEKILINFKNAISKINTTLLSLFTQTDKEKNNKKQKINLRKIKKAVRKIFRKKKEKEE